jgi:hypothetical protein
MGLYVLHEESGYETVKGQMIFHKIDEWVYLNTNEVIQSKLTFY